MDYYDVTFEQAFEIIEEDLQCDYGNLVLKAVELVSDKAKWLSAKEQDFLCGEAVSVDDIDAIQEELNKMQSVICELITERHEESVAFKLVCEFIWDHDLDYFQDQIEKFAEAR